MNIYSSILISLVAGNIALSSVSSHAQEQETPDIQEELSKLAKEEKKEDDIIFTLAVENDLFGPANGDNN